ncbi:MAG: DMT family transporter [Actinophytocola sp.]|uniref:DMT family transporter n=1 Tax=Actinophytocola sp. TaxID=1872138 RepID=UPI003C7367E9
MTSMSRTSLVQFLLLGTIWGTSYTFIKAALDGLSPTQLVLARLGLGLVFLIAILLLWSIGLPKMGKVWGHLAVASALGMVIPFLLLGYGEQRTSAAMAGMLIAVLPLATLAAVTIFLPSEKVSRRKLYGFLLGFAGVAMIVAPWQGDPGELTGQLAVIAAACSYAVQTVYIRKFLVPHGLSPVAQAAGQVIMALLLQIVTLPAFGWSTPEFSWPVVVSVLLLGVFGTGAAYVLYFKLITDLGAATASSVNYLVPVVGAVASTTLLGDSLTWYMVTGVLTVMAGLAIAEGRLSRKKTTPAPAPAPATVEKAASNDG